MEGGKKRGGKERDGEAFRKYWCWLLIPSLGTREGLVPSSIVSWSLCTSYHGLREVVWGVEQAAPLCFPPGLNQKRLTIEQNLSLLPEPMVTNRKVGSRGHGTEWSVSLRLVVPTDGKSVVWLFS